jgi:peptide/nickel transport system substrate-binding protein
MNNSRPPFNDIRVRKAVGYALDKEEISQAIGYGLGATNNQAYPKGHIWFADIEDPFSKPDLKRAKELLAEAGYPDGFSVNVPVEQAFVQGVKATQIVQSQLDKIGIKMKLEMMETAAHYVKRRQSDFDMVLVLLPIYPDPHWGYEKLYSKSVENPTRFNNPEFDRIFREAGRISSLGERKKLYTQVVRIINQDVPQIYISHYPEVYGVGARIQGFQPNSLATPDYVDGGFRKAWIKK